MHRRNMTSLPGAAALALLLAPAVPPSAAADSARVFTQADIDAADACGKGRKLGAGDSLICLCPAEGRDRFIWGNGPYAGHSDICTAARHAGVIDATGGPLLVEGRDGLRRYEASEAHGIRSKRWGAYSTSFVVTPARVATHPLTADSPDPVLRCAGFAPEAAPYTCACPPDSAEGGSVWGSGPYTGDSDVCRAAVHAGAIGPTGGTVLVTAAPGRETYLGTTQNGVSTSKWGAYDISFEVSAPTAPVIVLEEVCATMPADATRLVCTCPAEAPISKSVWGSGPYTADSDICTAARHAGVAAVAGGAVTVLRMQGLESYSGSAAHGVTTSKWGAFDSSITFDRN